MTEMVNKPKGETYDTTDQMMCEVLMMAGFCAASVLPTGDGSLIYSFKIEEVWPTIEKILTGNADNMTFRYTDWWKAKITWQMNLRHYSHSRRQK
jgi:hypothetical protein